MELNSAVSALSGLAQGSRLAIYRVLVQAGANGMPAGVISEKVGIAPSSLSFHLKELTLANLVTSRQAGRFVIYTANFSTMNDLLSFLTENCCGGNPCVAVCTPACSTHEETQA